MSRDDPSRVPEYLRHMLQAIERIERYTAVLDESAFLASDEKQMRSSETSKSSAKPPETSSATIPTSRSGTRMSPGPISI